MIAILVFCSVITFEKTDEETETTLRTSRLVCFRHVTQVTISRFRMMMKANNETKKKQTVQTENDAGLSLNGMKDTKFY